MLAIVGEPAGDSERGADTASPGGAFAGTAKQQHVDSEHSPVMRTLTP